MFSALRSAFLHYKIRIEIEAGIWLIRKGGWDCWKNKLEHLPIIRRNSRQKSSKYGRMNQLASTPQVLSFSEEYQGNLLRGERVSSVGLELLIPLEIP